MLEIFSIVLLVLVNPTLFEQCHTNATGLDNRCHHVEPIDLAIAIDHSIYRGKETEQSIQHEFGQKYHRFYRDFFTSLEDVTKFTYLQSKFRRIIGTTDWQIPFYVIRQRFNDGDQPINFEPPYQTTDATMTKSGLGELFAAIYEEDVKRGRKDGKMKVAMVLTRGTMSKEDENVIKEMNNLMNTGYKIYILFFTGSSGVSTNLLSDVFLHQTDEASLKNWELLVYYLGEAHRLKYVIPKCICNFLDVCKWAEIHCGYQVNSDGVEECAAISRRCLFYCPKAKCHADCELKGWTKWSECVEGIRTRKRINETAGYSNITKSCPKEMTEKCGNGGSGSVTTTLVTDGVATDGVVTGGVVTDGGSTRSDQDIRTPDLQEKGSSDFSTAIVGVAIVCGVLLMIGVTVLIVVCYRRTSGALKSKTDKGLQDSKVERRKPREQNYESLSRPNAEQNYETLRKPKAEQHYEMLAKHNADQQYETLNVPPPKKVSRKSKQRSNLKDQTIGSVVSAKSPPSKAMRSRKITKRTPSRSVNKETERYMMLDTTMR